MYEKIANPWPPSWIPDTGHALRHAGIHFDAVRMTGAQAERVAAELVLRTNHGCLAYVGVPALTGVTWPLDWRSMPTEGVPFVAGELLYEVVGRVRVGAK